MRSKNVKYSILILGVAWLAYVVWQEASAVRAVQSVGVVDTLPPQDCGVVLTGASGRLREAFEILAQKKIKKLVISGVYKETQLREIFPHLPFYPEVHSEDIFLEKISGSTYGNAVQSLAVVQSLHCQNIVLITSQLHMYRAYKLFRMIYPDSISITAYPVVHLARDNSFLEIVVETIKSLFYSAFGRAL